MMKKLEKAFLHLKNKPCVFAFVFVFRQKGGSTNQQRARVGWDAGSAAHARCHWGAALALGLGAHEVQEGRLAATLSPDVVSFRQDQGRSTHSEPAVAVLERKEPTAWGREGGKGRESATTDPLNLNPLNLNFPHPPPPHPPAPAPMREKNNHEKNEMWLK